MENVSDLIRVVRGHATIVTMAIANLTTIDCLRNAIGLPHRDTLLSLPLLHTVLEEGNGLILIADDDGESDSVAHTELELRLVLHVDLESVLNAEHLVLDRLTEHRRHHLQVSVHAGSCTNILILKRDPQLDRLNLVRVGRDTGVLERDNILFVLNDGLGARARLFFAAEELDLTD